MPRYDYECGACGRREELVFTMSSMPQSVLCDCGEQAVRVIDTVPNGWVTDRPYVFDKARNVMSNGRLVGRSDQKQHELYRDYFDGMRKEQDRVNRSCGKKGARWIGGMPGEMVDSISEHEGKEAVYKDPKKFLKKTGLYAGD